MARLTGAMAAHPELVAGEGRACTALIREMRGAGVVKTGAEGVFTAILPGRDRGLAVKALDGATRAAEAAIAALLVREGTIDGAAPAAAALVRGPILNRRGIQTGHLRLAG
jgi:L-asparaginase II